MSGVAVAENWYVVLTKPRKEKRALHHLYEQGGEVFLLLMLIRLEEIRSGALTKKQYVMFLGYLFLKTRSDFALLSKVRFNPGARMLLSFGVDPVIAHQFLIDSLNEKCFQE